MNITWIYKIIHQVNYKKAEYPRGYDATKKGLYSMIILAENQLTNLFENLVTSGFLALGTVYMMRLQLPAKHILVSIHSRSANK